MGVLQKAYTFVKKHWSIDDDVFPDDLNRYEDGIDDLYSVTNQTDTNIGNLSNLLSQAKSNIVTAINEIVTNLQSEIETRGNTDTELERQINVLLNESEINLPISTSGEAVAIRIKNSIAQGQLSGRYRYTSGHSNDAPIAKHGIISYKKTNQSKTTDIIFFADSGELYTATIDGVTGGYISDWRPIATTTKTDISLLNGWTVYVGEVNAVKIGNLVTIPDVRLKGGTSTKGTILFNLPQGFRPPATRHVMTIKSGTTPTLLTVSSNGNVSILYDDFVGTSDISYTVGFSFLIA